MYCRGRLILASNDPTAADEFRSAVIEKVAKISREDLPFVGQVIKLLQSSNWSVP